MFFEYSLLLQIFGLSNGEFVSIISVIVGAVGGGFGLLAKSRQGRLEANVETTRIVTETKVDEAKVLLDSYRDQVAALMARIKELEAGNRADAAAADAALDKERVRREEAERGKARLEGTLAALMKPGTPENMQIDTVEVNKLKIPGGMLPDE